LLSYTPALHSIARPKAVSNTKTQIRRKRGRQKEEEEEEEELPYKHSQVSFSR
jgi:hypothetical protein